MSTKVILGFVVIVILVVVFKPPGGDDHKPSRNKDHADIEKVTQREMADEISGIQDDVLRDAKLKTAEEIIESELSANPDAERLEITPVEAIKRQIDIDKGAENAD